LQNLDDKLENALKKLEDSSEFNKARFQNAFLDISGRVLLEENGLEILYALAPRFDKAGLFHGTDWDNPSILLPNLVKATFESKNRTTIVLEILSQLRFLSIANNCFAKPSLQAEQAKHFLTQVMALNLSFIFGPSDEALRESLGRLNEPVRNLFHFHLQKIGFEDILGSLIDEIWRILSQRPVLVDDVKSMVTQIAIALTQEGFSAGSSGLGADRLVSALFGPTQACQDDPGIDVYIERLASMDDGSLQQEAYGFARSMHDVGLVSDYHVIFIRWLVKQDRTTLIADALGLSSTGLDAFRSYRELVITLIEEALFIQTAQSVYGLALFLERGILYSPTIAPSLWGHANLQLSKKSKKLIEARFGSALPPRVFLLAATLSLLGQPFGIAQGNNPTCQSARAISMWSYAQPDYLLYLISHVASSDSISMHFEGKKIISSELPFGLISGDILDTGAVSILLVPHLDRIYNEMGRMCAGRNEDPHKWINPEFHGWWVGREFLIAVDIQTGLLKDYDNFLKRFYRSYHPMYNGNKPIIHPQPAGLAVTDSNANFVGWHAITLIRVALDQMGVMRAYFYNPNNDSGQDWGHGVIASTQGFGERFGEASLPFKEMLSRIYIFHDEQIVSEDVEIPEGEIEAVKSMAVSSWAITRV
jgi:hypothetical protein